jgi:hypothetical protein
VPGGWRRLRAGFAEAWRTHPSPLLRSRSLTDPRALFALDPTSMIVTGFAADLVFDSFPYLSYTVTEAKELLVAGLVIAIGGIAQWRAAVYAVLTGRPVPAGWRSGLWLGIGVGLGELFGPGQEEDARWLPVAPEVVLVLVATLVLLMAWVAQNAEWWIRSWPGRSLRPAMLLGLAAPWLVFASILYWWEQTGNELIDGWVYSTAGILRLYGIPGVPPAHIGLLLDTDVVLSLLPGYDASAGGLWWAVPLLWLVPLCVLTIRRLTGRPEWLVRARPGSRAPLPRQLPDLRRIWGAGLFGAVACGVAMEDIMVYAHPRVPFGNLVGPYILVRTDWPELVTCGAMVLTAVVVAAAADTAWLLTSLIAAGITSVLSLAVVFALTSADGCLGPFSTLTTTCGWLPGSAWGLAIQEIPYPLTLGVFAAGLAAFAGRGARLLWQRWRTWIRLPATAPATPAPLYVPARSGRVPRLTIARVTVILLIAAVAAVAPPVTLASYGSGTLTNAQDNEMTASPSAPSPAVAQVDVNAWSYVGGFNLVEDLSAAEESYGNAINALAKGQGGSAGQYTAALRKLDASCSGLAQVTRNAAAFLPVPDPSGQQLWTQALTGYHRLATACRNLLEHQSQATADAAGKADQQAYNALQASIHWLADMGTLRILPAAPSTSR